MTEYKTLQEECGKQLRANLEANAMGVGASGRASLRDGDQRARGVSVMKTKTTMGLIAFLAIAVAGISSAQVVRNTKETADDRKALEVGEAQLERDMAQLAAFESKVEALEEAFAQKRLGEVRSLKKDIVSDMRREIEQSERKIEQDKKELSQSRSEVSSSRREVRRSRRDRVNDDGDVGEGRDLRDDRRDRRDDRRDAQDDTTDLERQVGRTARQKQILSTLEAFTFSDEPTVRETAIANIKLMREFLQTMEADVAATRAELAEDRGELTEDRRERREDRRERRERRRHD
jgi:hypothetical protein